MTTAKKLIAGAALATFALLGSAGAASAGTSPAGQAHDVIEKAGELPVVGELVRSAVRPH